MIPWIIGVGYVLGFALFFDEIPPGAALWVSSGVPVLNLILLGVLLGPQLVAGVKEQGGYDFVQALPVPRTAAAAPWYVVTLVGGLIADAGRAYLVVTVWGVACGWLAVRALGRRR